ncbi:HAD-IIA family hydrolase [Arcobacter sp. F2176]|uniref:HAD-IIA family hydrolase n=1 Tax=Arcobacter sp. F2176 TaxID=2044511 RepID=UPI00100AF42B|nr:HAD-IIA family hydrolase [Arcobacter sp. F2176]RXJ80964.1 HAD family hydrolase [Arcobacter sp. F2176]
MNKAYFIDVQGTLIDDINKDPINGAIEFIDTLNEKNIPYVVITNNTKFKSEDFKKFLNDKGFNIKNYIDPFYILNTVTNEKTVAAFGTDEFLKTMVDLGYILDYENPKELIVSIKKDYTNEDYASMIEIALMVNSIIGMHDTSIYSKDGRRYPGVGAIMKMIKFATNKDYKVVGKPSIGFFQSAKNIINVDFKDIMIVSDDMIGDLIGAQNLGMSSCLVLSGKIKSEEEILSTLDEKDKPNFICKDIGGVLNLLNKGEI